MEDEQPKLEDALAEVEASCKSIVKEAKDKLQAVMTQIRDLVYQVKRSEIGTVTGYMIGSSIYAIGGVQR